MDDEKTKVLVADSHSCSRVGLCYILESNGFLVVAETNSLSNLVSLIEKFEPDILLFASNLLPAANRSLLTSLCPQDSKMSIVLLLDASERLPIREFYLSGIKGFIEKSEPVGTIIQMINTIATGGVTFSQALISEIMNSPTTDHYKVALSTEEKQLLHLLSSDRTNIEIAEILHISPKTVEKRLTLIYEKLDVKTRTGAVSWYLQQINREFPFQL